jgi:plasmid maintenance system antidote protein VapI
VTSITPALRGRLADNYVSLVTERMLRTPGGKKEGLPHPWAVHPGKHLRDAFLNPRKISVYKLAHATKLSVPRLYDLVKGECWINGMIDLRLCIYFGLQPGYFLHAQLFYLLFRATATKGRAARREVEPLAPTMIPGRHGRPRLTSGAVHSLRGSSQSGRPGRGKAAPER